MTSARTCVLACIVAITALSSAPRAMPQTPNALSSIVGTITDDERRPISRVLIIVIGTARRTALSDAEGRYVIDALPPGQYDLRASHVGHVATWFGNRAVVQSSYVEDSRTAIELAAGDRQVANVTMRRSATISGVVSLPDGAPAAGAMVTAVPSGVRAQADEQGRYRLSGLNPDAYLISAGPDGPYGRAFERTVNGERRKAILPTVFFPGVRRAAAESVTVAVGQERQAIDIRMMTVPVADVRVTVRDSHGAAVPVQIALRSEQDVFGGFGEGGFRSAPQGEVQFSDVVAGDYMVAALTKPSDSNESEITPKPEWGRAHIVVVPDGRSTIEVPLRMEPGASLSGTVVYEGPFSKEPGWAHVYVIPAAAAGQSRAQGLFSAEVENAGRLRISGIAPGRYTVQTFAPDGWFLASAVMHGTDVLDSAFEIGNRDLDGLVVTFASRQTEISGTVLDGNGRPSFERPVVVFSDDERLWTELCHRVRAAQPNTKGHFVVTGLPAGAYRVAAADFDQSDCANRSRLTELRARAVQVMIVAGEKKKILLTSGF